MSETANQLLDPTRDAEQIDCAEWPMRALPDAVDRHDGFQVIIAADALERIHKQGRSNLKAEVGGVLVGNVYQDEHGPYLWIDAIVEGRSMRHHAAQVTFTAETWADIQQTMDKDFPDARIVGWYHTHPGFGIFLSEMDLFIQDNFFNLPWQTALVYDPKSGEEGVFVWRGGKTHREEFVILEREPRQEAASPDSLSQSPWQGDSLAPAFPPMTFDELAARQLDLERRIAVLSRQSLREINALRYRNRWLIAGLLFVLSFTLAWSLLIVKLFVPHSPAASGLTATSRPVK